MGAGNRPSKEYGTSAGWFARAGRLYESSGQTPSSLREPASGRRAFRYTERHLQCVWYDPRFRPDGLTTRHGERLTVEDPGTWNLEAGPDFLGAVARIGPDRRRIEGDVELHIAPSGWKQHGHAHDPRYRGVRLHVTYFPGAVPADLLPPGAVQIELRGPLRRDPTFSFEAIDVAAYPYAIRSPTPPCQQVLRDWRPEEKSAVLDAAGEERIRRKTERILQRIDEVGPDQAVYEEGMAALGYKHNKVSFRRLAMHAPWERLRADCRSPTHAYAVLAGVAGLLPESPASRWDTETRTAFRGWWDAWWKVRGEWEAQCLDPAIWRLHGLRPANHPRRRLMAAAALFFDQAAPVQRWERRSPSADRPPWDAAAASMRELYDPFWSHRLSLGSPRHQTAVALLGPDRIHAMLVNVVVPFLAARGVAPAASLDALPPEADNQLMRQTAHWLLGRDHPPRLYRSALRRQGLLQIFHDFCLIDRSHCAACRFPAMLHAYRESEPL